MPRRLVDVFLSPWLEQRNVEQRDVEVASRMVACILFVERASSRFFATDRFSAPCLTLSPAEQTRLNSRSASGLLCKLKTSRLHSSLVQSL